MRLDVGACGAVDASERSLRVLTGDPVSRALERAVDRRHAVVEELRDLARGPVEHVAQHEHYALLWREQLHRCDECQPDGFARLGRDCGLTALGCDGFG